METASPAELEQDLPLSSLALPPNEKNVSSGDSHRLLTCNDVAELLRVSERTVRRLVERGELAEVRIGPTIQRFHPSDVEAFIATRREQKRPKRPVLEATGKTELQRRSHERAGYADRMRAIGA